MDFGADSLSFVLLPGIFQKNLTVMAQRVNHQNEWPFINKFFMLQLVIGVAPLAGTRQTI